MRRAIFEDGAAVALVVAVDWIAIGGQREQDLLLHSIGGALGIVEGGRFQFGDHACSKDRRVS